MNNKAKLSFFGGTGSVAGSNFFLEIDGKKILVDIGLSGECGSEEKFFPYDPKNIDYVFISHADLNNMGKLPNLVKNGFKGTIFSTPETKSISEIIFKDCLASNLNKIEKNYLKEDDLKNISSLWKTVKYGEEIYLGDGVKFTVFDAGHILGSAFFNFEYNGKNLLFANSVGGSFLKTLSGMDKIEKFDYLVIESVYGNKAHSDLTERKSGLEDVIESTINRKGNVLIPISFVDKIYLILKDILSLQEAGRVPKVPIFVNSSLAMKTADIYGEFFKCDGNKCENLDSLVSRYDNLKYIKNEADIDEMCEYPNSKIILGDVGFEMSREGKKNILDNISNPNSSIIFADYQMVGTMGRKLQDGASVVTKGEQSATVLAQIETIDGYSSHADHNRLFQFVSDIREGLKTVFVVTGEPKSSIFFAQRLKDYLGVNAKVPKRGDYYELDF